MRRILLFVLIILVTFMTCTFAFNGNVYEDKNTFRITVPYAWQISKVEKTLFAATASNHSTIKIYITIANKEDPFSSKEEEEEEFATLMIKETSTLKDKSHLKIDSRDAIRTISVDDKKSIYDIQYTFYKDGVIFFVVGEGELNQLDEDQKVFDQIMSSFEFL